MGMIEDIMKPNKASAYYEFFAALLKPQLGKKTRKSVAQDSFSNCLPYKKLRDCVNQLNLSPFTVKLTGAAIVGACAVTCVVVLPLKIGIILASLILLIAGLFAVGWMQVLGHKNSFNAASQTTPPSQAKKWVDHAARQINTEHYITPRVQVTFKAMAIAACQWQQKLENQLKTRIEDLPKNMDEVTFRKWLPLNLNELLDKAKELVVITQQSNKDVAADKLTDNVYKTIVLWTQAIKDQYSLEKILSKALDRPA